MLAALALQNMCLGGAAAVWDGAQLVITSRVSTIQYCPIVDQAEVNVTLYAEDSALCTVTQRFNNNNGGYNDFRFPSVPADAMVSYVKLEGEGFNPLIEKVSAPVNVSNLVVVIVF